MAPCLPVRNVISLLINIAVCLVVLGKYIFLIDLDQPDIFACMLILACVYSYWQDVSLNRLFRGHVSFMSLARFSP